MRTTIRDEVVSATPYRRIASDICRQRQYNECLRYSEKIHIICGVEGPEDLRMDGLRAERALCISEYGLVDRRLQMQ